MFSGVRCLCNALASDYRDLSFCINEVLLDNNIPLNINFDNNI